MIILYSNAVNNDLWNWITILSSNIGIFIGYTITNFSVKKRIFIHVFHIGFSKIYLINFKSDWFGFLNFLLVGFFLVLNEHHIGHKLLLYFIEIHSCHINSAFLQELFESIIFFLKFSYHFICSTFIYHGLIFNFFGLISIP